MKARRRIGATELARNLLCLERLGKVDFLPDDRADRVQLGSTASCEVHVHSFDDEEEPEGLDLAALAFALARYFGDLPPQGYVIGKTAFRDALMETLRCSAVLAEQLVDRMQARGFIQYTGNPGEAGGGNSAWSIVQEPRIA